MSTPTLFEQISRACSPDRLEAYRTPGDSDLEVLTRYVWNTCLCEALYPAIHNLEIGFRNTLHAAIEKSYGDPQWFKDSSILVEAAGQERVAEAERELRKRGKTITPGRVVAELHFGFWTSLLSVRYDYPLWRRPGLLKDAFPYMSKYIRKRHPLAARFGDIRKLRNRVSHHEPIWNRPDLLGEHAGIIEALGWIAPSLVTITRAVDRFQSVHAMTYYEQIKASLSS